MSRLKLDRRTMLKGMLGAGVVSVGLPALEIFYDPPYSAGRARACPGSAYPKRLGWWFWGNGVLPNDWVPATEGPGWEPSPLLMPLSGLRSKLSVLSNLSIRTPNTDPHGSGPAGLFAGDNLTPQEGGVARTGTFIGPSFDQIVANAVGQTTRFPSLEVGVQRSDNGLSYAGPYAVNPPESSPIALFNRIFGEGFRAPGESSGPDPRLALRRSVLDGVREQATSLSSRLGASDRARLDAHLEGIRAIELQIEALQADPPDYPACMRPTAPDADYPDVEGRPQMSAVSRVMSDLVAMALACDQTRVFSVMYSQPVNNTLFGAHSAGHHQLTHDEPDPQPEVNDIVVSIMSDLAYFLGALDAIDEVDGTLLDHSAVLCTTDVSFGRTHSIDEYPIVLAGSCCGTFRMGEHIRAPGGDNATKLILSLIRGMDVLGVDADAFGRNAGYVEDGLSSIEVA